MMLRANSALRLDSEGAHNCSICSTFCSLFGRQSTNINMILHGFPWTESAFGWTVSANGVDAFGRAVVGCGAMFTRGNRGRGRATVGLRWTFSAKQFRCRATAVDGIGSYFIKRINI
jgi:hypothetical protein